jgi:cephalosporin hydroxylase
MATLPPSVSVNLETDSLLAYWRQRVAQHIHDVYAGVPLSKFPEDLRVYEHLIWLSAPEVVVEVGTQHGGSALWFRDRLWALRRYGRVDNPSYVGVDIDQAAARRNIAQADPTGITLIEGDVADAQTVRQVEEAVGGRRCLVIEDSAHTYETTMASLRGLTDLVAPAGFFVVEDGCVDVEAMRIDPAWPRGVLPALNDWLEEGQDFVVRGDLELYGVTCHPGGFLQRASRGAQGESQAADNAG